MVFPEKWPGTGKISGKTSRYVIKEYVLADIT